MQNNRCNHKMSLSKLNTKKIIKINTFLHSSAIDHETTLNHKSIKVVKLNSIDRKRLPKTQYARHLCFSPSTWRFINYWILCFCLRNLNSRSLFLLSFNHLAKLPSRKITKEETRIVEWLFMACLHSQCKCALHNDRLSSSSLLLGEFPLWKPDKTARDCLLAGNVF